MIGHYLLTLCPEAEDAILTGRLEPGSYGIEDVRCLVGWACDATAKEYDDGDLGRPDHQHTNWTYISPEMPAGMFVSESVEGRFDKLCARFGTERIGRLIRERIWHNRGLRAAMRRKELEREWQSA